MTDTPHTHGHDDDHVPGTGHGHTEAGHGHADAGHGHSDAPAAAPSAHGHGHTEAGHGHADAGHGHGHSGGAGHGHGHGIGAYTAHAGAKHRWRLWVALCITVGFFGVELVTGIVTGSLALITDAGHMAADGIALSSALVATHVATRTDKSGRRTFGSYRAEVFASGLAVLIMLGVAAFIAFEAFERIGTVTHIDTGPVMIVGAIGIVLNMIAMALLHGGSKESLNIKGAYLEVMSDTLGSAGVMLAGFLVYLTGNQWWDTAVALAIGLFVSVRAIMLGREVLHVLGQHAPKETHPKDIEEALRSTPGVADVHDLHVWTLTSGMHVASAHLVAHDHVDQHHVLDAALAVMEQQFSINHVTFQVEPTTHKGCDLVAW